MTQTTETSDTDLDAAFDAAFTAMVAEALNAPLVDLPVTGNLIPFPSPFAAN